MDFQIAHKLEEILQDPNGQQFLTAETARALPSTRAYAIVYFLSSSDYETLDDSPVIGAVQYKLRSSEVSGPFSEKPKITNPKNQNNVVVKFIPVEQVPDRFDRVTRLNLGISYDDWVRSIDCKKLNAALQALADRLVSASTTPELKVHPEKDYSLSINGCTVRLNYRDVTSHPLAMRYPLSLIIIGDPEQFDKIVTEKNLYDLIESGKQEGASFYEGRGHVNRSIERGLSYTLKGEQTATTIF
jgi:hypothetical protein